MMMADHGTNANGGANGGTNGGNANNGGLPSPLPLGGQGNVNMATMAANMAAVAASNPAVAAAMKLHEEKEQHRRLQQQYHAAAVAAATANANAVNATSNASNTTAAQAAAAAAMAAAASAASMNASTMIPATTAAAISSNSVSGGRKSLAYVHTVLLKHMTDSSGKQHEMRQCLYCDAAFSFKGGTTSAALRHVKTSHPEQLYAAEAMMMRPPKRMYATPSTSTIKKQQQQQQQPQAPLQPAHDPRPSTSSATASRHAPSNDPHLNTHQLSTPSTTSMADVDHHPFDDSDDTATMPSSPSHGLASRKRARHDVLEEDQDQEHDASASGNASLYHAQQDALEHEEDDPSQLLDSADDKTSASSHHDMDEQQIASLLTTADAIRALAASHQALSSWRKKVRVLTPSQEAITHFMEHYKELLTLNDRLRFVKHLTHQVADAEMYNVLDHDTRLAFIREFSTDPDSSTASAASATTSSNQRENNGNFI